MLVDIKDLPQYSTVIKRMANELINDKVPLQQLKDMRESQLALGIGEELLAHAWVHALDLAIDMTTSSSNKEILKEYIKALFKRNQELYKEDQAMKHAATADALIACLTKLQDIPGVRDVLLDKTRDILLSEKY